MSLSRSLQKLLRIRGVEEEQRRRALEASEAELGTLVQNAKIARQTEQLGRRREVAGMVSGEITERQAGLVECAGAQKRSRILAARIVVAETETAAGRQAFLEKRVERQQVETLVEQAAAREAVETLRRSQRDVDDWFGTRNHRKTEDDNGCAESVPDSD
jgi:flagellar biosynthesis chaperone FliJ